MLNSSPVACIFSCWEKDPFESIFTHRDFIHKNRLGTYYFLDLGSPNFSDGLVHK